MRSVLSKQTASCKRVLKATDGKRDSAALSHKTDTQRDTHRVLGLLLQLDLS